MRIKQMWRRAGLRWRRGAVSGSVAIEFAFIAPILLVLIFAVIEVGLIYFGQFVLKNATDAAARVIKTGNATAYSSNPGLVDYICSKGDSGLGKVAANIILPKCSQNLRVYVRSYPATSGFTSFPSIGVSDLTNNGTTGNTTTLASLDAAAKPCAVQILRVTFAWDVVTPLLTWFLVNYGSGQHLISATEVFQNESAPGSTSACS